MKKTFNIYGERNSGTNFLKTLIEQNFDLTPNMNGKHRLVVNYNPPEDHITFCIIRNLNDWVFSTFKNPYHIKDDYDKTHWGLYQKGAEHLSVIRFANKRINSSIYDPCRYDINLGDKYNLVELRYLKYNSYKRIINKVLVNLDFLQHSDENKENFLNFISKKYNLEQKTFNPIKEYKGGQGVIKGYRDSKYTHPFYPKLNLNKLKSYNKEIEEEINNLTFKAC